MKNRLFKDNLVYVVSTVVTIAVILYGLIFPQNFGAFAITLNTVLTKYYGWGYMLAINVFVVFCIAVAFSRFKNKRLGPDDSRPEYSRLSWFAMLFSAGMGVGLVFYGAAEPLFHFASCPFGADPNSIQAARDAMQAPFFIGGFTPGPAMRL